MKSENRMKNTFLGFGWSKINRRDIKDQNDVSHCFPIVSTKTIMVCLGIGRGGGELRVRGEGEERGGEGRGMITTLFGY